MKNPFALVPLAFLVLVLALGGAASQGIPANALLQLLAAFQIVWLTVFVRGEAAPPIERSLRFAIIAAIVLAAVQFIPLPPSLWTHLPGREGIADGFRLLGMALPWQTLSLAPWHSLASLTWCLPAIAVFLFARSARGPSVAAYALVIVAVAGVSVALGITQRISGDLYFYPITNYGLAVGLFANANHQASFVVCALLFWTAYYGLSPAPPMSRLRNRQPQASAVLFFGVAIFLIIGVLLCGSLAGTGLLALALAGGALILMPQWRPRPAILVALFVTFTLGAIAFGYFGSGLPEFLVDTEQPGMSRVDFWHNGMAMLATYLPFGSGLGTFREVYHLFENPDLVQTTYANHAHNDFLELVIETGTFGIAVIAAFVIWIVRRGLALRGGRADVGACALVLVVLTLTLHSLVDYPLRTAAVSSILALAVGLLTRAGNVPRDRTGGPVGRPFRITT